MSLLVALFLGSYFSLSYNFENGKMRPRLTQQNPGDWTFPLPTEQPNAMFYLDEPNSLYIGGEEVLYHYHFKPMNNYTYKINAETYNCQGKAFCKNFVTFVTRLEGHLLICGTNAYNPACWKMDGGKFEKHSTSWAEQLSPRFPGFNYNILNTGNEMYSTIPKQSNNAASTKKATFKKILGKDPMRYTGGNLLKNPVFVKSLAVEGEQKTESRIFLFFMDDNSELRTTDKRVPMIARMCKEEMGSVKPDERNMFSTALKSRLICGDPEGQYYNILQDIYFLQSQDLVYGLFTNAWNHSAVCSYKIENIESVFNTSDLFGSEKKDLKIRPGKCLSERTPQETADEAANHPELVDWVWPLGNRTVFQTLEYYRKLAVDEIAAKNEIWRVIIVATDSGLLHKVVVDRVNEGAMNVLEMQPFDKTGNILFLQLGQNNKEHALYVGTANAIYRIFLDDCRAYNKSCTDCRLSQDPYCDWYMGKCQSILNRDEVLQNSTQGAMCEKMSKTLAQVGHPHTYSKENNVLPPSVYHLTCPAESKQATYWWIYGDNHTESCTPHNGKCNLFFDQIKFPGEYKCMEAESSKSRLVSEYKFTVGNSSSRMKNGWLEALAIPVCIILYIHLTLFANS